MKRSDEIYEKIKDAPDFTDKVTIVLENGFAVSRAEAKRLVYQISEKKEKVENVSKN